MPLLLAPILLMTYTLAIYHWKLAIGRISLHTPWFSLDESTPLILAYIFTAGLAFIYIGMFLSWLCRIPILWRQWRTNRLFHKAVTLYLFGLYDKALKKTEICIRLQPKNAVLIYMKGRILDTMGQKTEALATYTTIKKYPLLKHHGLILLLKQDPLQRHAAINSAFKLLPRSPFLHNLLSKQGSYLTNPEDIIDYSGYVKDNRNDARAQVYLLKGQLTHNPKWLKKAWQYDPRDLSIFYHYLKSATSSKHAFKIAKKAYKYYPHPVIMQTILNQLNITDPLEQYVYVQKHGGSSPENSFLLSHLKRQISTV